MQQAKEPGFQWYHPLWSTLNMKILKMCFFTYLRNTFLWNFILEPSFMSLPTFCMASNISKKALVQITVLQGQFFKDCYGKVCSFRPRFCLCNLMNNLQKHLAPCNKVRPESFWPWKGYMWFRKLKRFDTLCTSFTWYMVTVPSNVFQILQNLPCQFFPIDFRELLTVLT